MAWVQHMIRSMNNNGRMAVVLPNGVLFRKGSEEKIRKFILDQDLIEAIIGIGSNIFYGTQLSPCILVFRKNKEHKKKNKVFFIDASTLIRVGRAQNYLDSDHIEKIFKTYFAYEDIENFSKVISLDVIKSNQYSLNIPLYIEKKKENNLPTEKKAMSDFKIAWNKKLESEKEFKDLLMDFIS